MDYFTLNKVNLIGDAAIPVGALGEIYLQNTLLDTNKLRDSNSLKLTFPWLSKATLTIDCAISIVNIYNINGAFNYFHWINDSILLLEAWHNYIKRTGVTPFVVVPDTMNQVQNEILQELKVPSEKLISWNNSKYRVNTLIVFSTNRTPQKPMDILHTGSYRWLKNCLIEKVKNKAYSFENVFISRKKASGRKFVNEATFQQWLLLNEIEEVVLEDFSFLEQLSIFYSAKRIYGPHGAGFTNIFMCKPGSKVIEIFGNPPNSYTEYFRLATQFKLNYFACLMKYIPIKGVGSRYYQEIDLVFDESRLPSLN
ncbi:MAG: glycosyltransferase family 61 protein [Cyclobacteriaceae bacterium]